MEDKIIELADYFISENTTYREAKIACEKLLKQVIVDYIDYYNNKRIKVKLKGLSPVQYKTKSFG